jgi:hypothetical protein
MRTTLRDRPPRRTNPMCSAYDMNGTRAFIMGSPERRAGVVLLTNSNTRLRLIHELLASVLPGDHPAARWLAEGVSK